MKMDDVVQMLMLGLAFSGVVGGVIGYLIKQNSRIATIEAEVEQLRISNDRNAKTLNDLAINLSKIGERVELLLQFHQKSQT